MEKELFEELATNAKVAVAHSRGEATENVRVLADATIRPPQAVLEANNPA